MTDVEKYLRNIIPRDYFIVEVLPKSHPHYSRLISAYAARIISIPMQVIECEANWFNPDDIILVDGFRQVFTEDHFANDAVDNQWTSVMASELRDMGNRVASYRDEAASIGRPLEAAEYDTTERAPDLQAVAARRLLEEGKTLYAYVNAHSVFGKVLQQG